MLSPVVFLIAVVIYQSRRTKQQPTQRRWTFPPNHHQSSHPIPRFGVPPNEAIKDLDGIFIMPNTSSNPAWQWLKLNISSSNLIIRESNVGRSRQRRELVNYKLP
jgi:hypothetical protein